MKVQVAVPCSPYSHYGICGRKATLKKNRIELKLGIFSVFVCRAHKIDSTVPQPQQNRRQFHTTSTLRFRTCAWLRGFRYSVPVEAFSVWCDATQWIHGAGTSRVFDCRLRRGGRLRRSNWNFGGRECLREFRSPA